MAIKLKSKLRNLLKKGSFKHGRFSKVDLIIFALIFVAVGGYFLYSSFAATTSTGLDTEASTTSTSSIGDINNDGIVDVFDLSILLSKYNTPDSTADLNSDNTVNIFDLSILLSHYGTSTQTGTCLASNNCYPKPLNSGVGATGIPSGHTPASGCTQNPASGAVLTDCLFTGIVDITTTGSGATYRYSKFVGQIRHFGTGTLTVEYSTLGPDSGCNNDDNAFTGSNYTLRFSRVNSHVHEGPRVAGSNILIEENFIGPLCSNPGDHADGIQGFGGGTNVMIRHNTIDERTAADVTSPIFFADSSESAQVEDNLVAGGGYSLRLHDDFTPDHGPWTLLRNRIVDNAWSFGPMNNAGTSFTAATCSDNRLVDIDSSYNITRLGSVVDC